MKKSAILILFFSLFFIFNMPVNSASTDEIKKEAGYISLNDAKEKELEPNFASVTFTVENTAGDAQSASSENNKITNKVINGLKLITSTDTDTINTTNFSLRPVYSTTSSGKRVIKNYTAVNSVTVETQDIKKIPKFIDSAVANGANKTNSLKYTIKNEKSYCNEMYPEIMGDLRKQANIIAESAGSSVTGIKRVSVSCSMSSNISNTKLLNARTASQDSDDTESVSTPVEFGKVKVKVYVNADFYVK